MGQEACTVFENAPSAFTRTLARPFIWETDNPLMLLAAIENVLLIIFMACCIFGTSSTIAFRWKGLHWSALFLVLSLGVLIGLITPILGALVRYKVPVLPFLVLILVTLPSRRWIHFIPNRLLK